MFDRFNALHYPFASRRSLVFSSRGMVATSQPLASQAGLDAIKAGGNAIDAAIAAASCLTVTEPTSNGIGSDAFALVWSGGKLHGLNSSGPSPGLLSAEEIREKGYRELPPLGWLPVTVPGAPAAWAELSRCFGKLSLKEVMKPAIDYARHGFPVSPVVAGNWQQATKKYRRLEGEEFSHWLETFAPGGVAPRAGQHWRFPQHAETLASIAESRGESFYRGALAQRIDEFSRRYGGYLRGEDLEKFQPWWQDPVKVDYRGYQVWEMPPNGQGIITLMALNLLKRYSLTEYPGEENIHRMMEAIKLAFADGYMHITDPNWMSVKIEELLGESWVRSKQSLLDKDASLNAPYPGTGGGTVYLAAGDGEGNLVSFIQSNYHGFGSGLVVPGTGIALQNRGHEFSLNPEHPNYLRPGKRTYHTIIPGFLSRGDAPLGPFGVMGGYMQPQGHLQFLVNLLDFGLNPQASLDAPRWKWVRGNTVELEHSYPAHFARSLADRGHDIQISCSLSGFGRGQAIFREPDTGVMCGATEPRADGTVSAW